MNNDMRFAFPPSPGTTHWYMILFFGCGGAFPLIHTSHAVTNYPTAFGLRISSSLNNNNHIVPYTDTNLCAVGYRNQMEVTHMVLQMLGRRQQPRQLPQQDSNTEQLFEWNNTSTLSNNVPATSSTAISSKILLSMINSMSAISSELLYRLYLPTLLYSLTSDYIVAILIPAVLYWSQSYSMEQQSIRISKLGEFQSSCDCRYVYLTDTSNIRGNMVFDVVYVFG